MEPTEGTLFIVEDDPRSRKALGALASSMKIKHEIYASAEEFLERYESSLSGCALLDYRLGGMDGLQLQGKLQAMNSMLSVVLISAHADVALAVRAMKNGALTLIEKPYQQDEMSDAIHQAMKRGEEVRRMREGSADQRQHLESLTAQERQMVDLVLAGVPQKRSSPAQNQPAYGEPIAGGNLPENGSWLGRRACPDRDRFGGKRGERCSPACG